MELIFFPMERLMARGTVYYNTNTTLQVIRFKIWKLYDNMLFPNKKMWKHRNLVHLFLFSFFKETSPMHFTFRKMVIIVHVHSTLPCLSAPFELTLSPPSPRSARHFWTIFSGFPEENVLMRFRIGIFRLSFTLRVNHFQLKDSFHWIFFETHYFSKFVVGQTWRILAFLRLSLSPLRQAYNTLSIWKKW